MSFQRAMAHLRLNLRYPPALAALGGFPGQAQRLTVSRPAPPLTYSELGGILAGWNPNELRSGIAGFLVEDAGRNLALNARQMHLWLAAGWGGGCEVTGNTADVMAPNGQQEVTRLFGSLPYSGGIGQAIATTAGQTYTFSAYVGGRCWLLARTVPNGGVGEQPVATPNFDLPTNALTRQSLTWTETVTGTRYVGAVVDSGNTAYLWGGQFEARAWPSSLIPTTAAAVNRDRDLVGLSASPMPSEFTVVASGSGRGDGKTLWECRAVAGNADLIQLARWDDTGQGRAFVQAGGVQQYSVSLPAAKGGPAQVGLTFKAGRYRMACNGALAAEAVGKLLPAGLVQHDFGQRSIATSVTLNGYLRPVLILPHAVSDADLAALTAA